MHHSEHDVELVSQRRGTAIVAGRVFAALRFDPSRHEAMANAGEP
jgi:hypothetical protein